MSPPFFRPLLRVFLPANASQTRPQLTVKLISPAPTVLATIWSTRLNASTASYSCDVKPEVTIVDDRGTTWVRQTGAVDLRLSGPD